jgi:hypothetical protein
MSGSAIEPRLPDVRLKADTTYCGAFGVQLPAPSYVVSGFSRTGRQVTMPGVQAGKGGMGRLGVPNTISVIALMLRFP